MDTENNAVTHDESKRRKLIAAIIAAVLIAVILIIFLIFNSKIRATTMRILRLEGVVTLFEGDKEKPVRESLRLKSGNVLDTAEQSLVSIGLDDAKIVTMNELSRAEFSQKGKKLDLKLTKGSLYFEVSKPLTEDESFDIRTSTMVVGIRGTSGYVSVEGGNESLIITDGHVHVVGTNPVTGEVKETDVYAGQRITVYLFNDRQVDSIEFFLEDITERQLPEFVLSLLRKNEKLLDRVIAATGWDKPWILGLGTKAADTDNNPQGTDPDNNDTGNKDENGSDVENGSADMTGNGNTITNTGDNTGNDNANAGQTGNRNAQAADNSQTGNAPSGNAAAQVPDPMESVLNGANGYRFGAVVMQMQIEVARQAISGTDPGTGNFILVDGTEFDPGYYAQRNPDVVEVYGTQPEALLAHWLFFGSDEKRPPSVPRLVAEESFDESQEEETEYHPENNDVAGDDGGSSSSSNSGGGGGSSSSSSSGGGGGGGGGGGSTNTPTSTQAYYDRSNGPAITLAGGATGEYRDGGLTVNSGNTAIDLPFTVTDTSTGTTSTLTKFDEVSFGGSGSGTVMATYGTRNVTYDSTTGQYTSEGNTFNPNSPLYVTHTDSNVYLSLNDGGGKDAYINTSDGSIYWLSLP